MMKVLVACEFSGIVRDAFRARGHDAWSCDLLPCESNSEFHIEGNILEHINAGYGLMIAHPPCTYLAVSGLHWNQRIPGRKQKTEQAIEFVKFLFMSDKISDKELATLIDDAEARGAQAERERCINIVTAIFTKWLTLKSQIDLQEDES